MKLHNFVIREEPTDKLIWHSRWFFRLYRNDELSTIASGHVELAVSRPTAEFGIAVKVGTLGSETPFDGHVQIAGTGIYWGIEQGIRVAEKITQQWCNRLPLEESRYNSREVNIYTHDGALWWNLWTICHQWTQGQFASWRSGRYSLNLLDHLYGERRYWYEDTETVERVVALPEESYPVTLTLQQQSFGRPRSRSRRKSWVVEVNSRDGIPYCRDHSEGWKGDRVYGFSVALKNLSHDDSHVFDWWVDAQAAIGAWVLQHRADTGFRDPLPSER